MNRIKELRREKGKTLDEMSEETSIKRGSINNYENGKNQPKMETWKKLADYFNVDIAYLQGLTDFRNQEEVNKRASSIINTLNKNEKGIETYLTDDEWFKLIVDSVKLDAYDETKKALEIIGLTLPEEEAKKVSENITKNTSAAPDLIKQIIQLEKIYSVRFDRKKEISEIDNYRIKQFNQTLEELCNDLSEITNK